MQLHESQGIWRARCSLRWKLELTAGLLSHRCQFHGLSKSQYRSPSVGGHCARQTSKEARKDLQAWIAAQHVMQGY